jgi:histidinol dehydrogenase
MRILDWSYLDRPGRRAALERPQPESRVRFTQEVGEIIDRVRSKGDAALRALTSALDKVSLETPAVCPDEFRTARRTLRAEQIAALERAVTNVRRFHELQAPTPIQLETEPGIRCEQLVRPIASVGLYVPGGTAPLPSALIMLAVPAQIAGCVQRIVCTPPSRDGAVHPAVLVAAELCNIDTVFKVGGAQAIAALAYGTESIPKVDKIFGPGNAWVTAAKQLVAADAQGAPCDLPAGPSEVLIVADDSARADLIAADLLAQAEHDALAQALLVTDSMPLAKRVVTEVQAQNAQVSRRDILVQSLKHSRAILVPDLDVALSVSNAYAPEHLILHVRQPRRWLDQVRNAGAVFLGPWSPETLGDYCSGTNHVLPTAGHARALSGLSVRDFTKTISVQEVTPAGLRALGPTAIALAGLEGLDAHAKAVTQRLAVLDGTSADTGVA